ncbi:SrfA family protein [Rahnella bonaserana]|uniref:SrfA family protein n=1 Tax=Rahnella bonaserana TaxID=2816248 RepID=UPI0024C2A43F|nr:SrfA family protein [Rahnella bonaserana]WHZ42631.1 SrfA family protein [Rahnella bonaserana]
MAKSFLRSGSLNDILALGENGQPVYASALQLRETLRLRKQPAIADCLAIPQLNEAGDRLDWYSPREGKVVSWAAATDAARATALRQLENCLDTVSHISKAAKSSGKSASQFFGALLEKAFRFPDQNHVYLVGGQPVLTFWGFVSLDSTSNPDPFAALRNTLKADEPLPSLSLAAEKVKTSEPVMAPEAPVRVIKTIEARAAEQEAVAPEPVAAQRRKISPLIWALPVAALVVAGSAAGWLYSRPPAPKAETAQTEISKPAPAAEPAVIAPPPVAEPAKAAEMKSPDAKTTDAAPLPVAPAAVVVPASEPVAEVEKTPVVAEPAPAPVSKNALVLPPDAVKIGSTKFLNGNWNGIVEIKDPVTGKPPVLRYQFRQGQGTVRITYGAGVTCRAPVNAGLMQSGNLVINTRYKAKCSDGSRYQMPEISCTQGATGAAVCQGRYNGDTVYPMTIKREGK